MISLIGTAALVGALLASVSAGWWWLRVASLGGGARAERLARGMTSASAVAAGVACLLLVYALVTHDFSVRYVAENGARAVPLYYTVISLWAALEGSILLWLFMLTAVSVIAMKTVQPRAAVLHPWVMAVLVIVGSFFAALALFGANPFERVWPAPADGPGPNPLLQDHPLMGIHPPLLYVGYVGLTVPFAYAVAALITGQTGPTWASVTRRWTLVAWTGLTLGVLMGGWWSYEVLGWGGYWAWDPVENAAILPWFTATAFLHSVMVQRRRAALRVWNLSLATASFLLMLVGTFLTRSGVIASVHAFTQSAIGPLLLGFTVAVTVAVLALFVWRSDRLGRDEPLPGGVSREAVFLGNNVLLVALAFTVLLGTVFPLLVEAFTGDRVSVGAPYFNRLTVPLALLVVLLMGVGPLVPWGQADQRALRRRLVGPALVGLGTVSVLVLAGSGGVAALLTFGLAAFVVATVVAHLQAAIMQTQRATGVGLVPAAVLAVSRRRRLYGGLTVHLGVVLAAVAIAASSTYATSGAAALAEGESLTVGRYEATLEGVEEVASARRSSAIARVALERDGELLRVAEPMLSNYPGMNQAIGTPSVRTGLTEDLYVTLTAVEPGSETATIRLAVNPGMLWLWIAAGVMAAGAVLAGWPSTRRRRGSPSAGEGPPAVALSGLGGQP